MVRRFNPEDNCNMYIEVGSHEYTKNEHNWCDRTTKNQEIQTDGEWPAKKAAAGKGKKGKGKGKGKKGKGKKGGKKKK